MDTPRTDRVRTVRLPRTVPLIEPISSVEAGYFSSAGFFMRIGIFGAVALCVFAILGLRLWSLQVLQGPRYVQLATQQTFRYVDLPAGRAGIVDAHGRPLAGVTGELVVTADPSSLGKANAHGVWQPNWEGNRILGRLALVARQSGLAHVRVPLLVKRIRHALVRSPYAPAVVLPRLTMPVSLYLDEHARAFPGLHVGSLPQRSYPQGALGGEFLGLLGEVGPTQLKDPRYRGSKPGEVVGQSGVERHYDRLLNGGLDRAAVAVDSLGRPVGPLRILRESAPQRVLRLTIDARVQRAAVKAVEHGIALAHSNGHYDSNSGSAVVIDPWTGAVKALVSVPEFSQVGAARDPSYYARLLSKANTATPLLNRATQGLYPAGSTFKPIVAEAAMSAGLMSPYTPISCTGSYTVGGVVFHNVEAGINATLDLPQALEMSCDTWFYRVGSMVYNSRAQLAIQQMAWKLGLGKANGFDGASEAPGLVPTPVSVQRLYKQPWYEGQTINLSIGQGYLQITPLQLAVAYSALANGGTVVRPHVGDAVLAPDGTLLRKLHIRPQRHVNLPNLWAIHDGLYAAAHGSTGTSTSVFGNFPVKVAGKTGTAEVPTGSDESWYASWAPSDHPRYVVVVHIDHGGFGAEAAAPAARDIYSALFRLPPAKG
jgi:penicillin-binding protein 2